MPFWKATGGSSHCGPCPRPGEAPVAPHACTALVPARALAASSRGAGSLLLWGTAFGIAIDHFVLKHDSSPGPQVQPAAAPDNPRARRSRATPERPISVESDRTMPSEPAVRRKSLLRVLSRPRPQSPRPAAAVGSLRTPANLPLSGSCRASCSDARCLHKSVCGDHPAVRAGRVSLPATASTTPPALPAPRAEAAAPALWPRH